MNSTASLFLTIGTIHILGVMSPGPDFALVLRTTLASGRRAGILAAAGIATSIIFYATLTIGGIARLAREHALIGQTIRIGGSLFLIYLGMTILIAAWKNRRISANMTDSTPTPNPLSDRDAYRNGVLTNLLNSKAVVYFTSILAPAFTAEVPIATQVGLGAMIVITTFAWFASLACFVSDPRVRARIEGALPILDVVLGVALLAFGIKTLIR